MMTTANSFGSYPPLIAADFIRKFEGERLKAYRDAAGVLTIGVGHTGPDVKPSMEITQAQSEALFRNDLDDVAERLARFVNVPVTPWQFIALVSLSFNVGSLPAKFPKLMRKLNAGDIEGAAAEFLDGDRAGGKRLPGLTRRRRAEHELFLKDS